MRITRWMRALAPVAGVLLLASCGLQSGSSVPLPVGPGSIVAVPALDGVAVTVGSKDFTEANILGYLIEFALTAAGANVRDLTNIQGSNSLRDAQLHGQVDIAYDYTGTGWINYLGNETPEPDEARQFELVRDADRAEHDMVWAAMAPMNNTYALVTSRRTAEETGVRTLSDYAALIAKDPAAAATCVGTEFNVRQDGYPGMARKYGIDVARVPKQIVQDALVYQATADAKQCRFGSVAATDGRIPALDLVLLDDDRGFFPKYNAALVLHGPFADAHPEVVSIMAPISARLTNAVITELNRQVDIGGREPADVARDWMVAEGLVTAG
ncbi:glycine/betaine ABC transporter substrate-binding protein [Nocardia asteroides NBRC 15531]|nr:glycine betaine ABC transporter substrate-binding protein [Nocardia asteroides]TLF64526.1 glycine/betaine ABC transporter substrate-binding protein [Nocardia asteroides NBRC 15531]UGT50364.1 glycine/betaine ABC transporter substrate-binding protein [Nocardia asteroides]SFN11012.1 osmoprotectant transport system substrate-binding protein [Nocardia asteroides]VEG36846.1 Osmoprotectant-binding protein [Nocardia asteroides]